MITFTRIKSNIFVPPAQPLQVIDYGFCKCKSIGQYCIECENVKLYEMECNQYNCSVGPLLCRNRNLQNKQWKNVNIIKTQKKGYGLFSQNSIKKNEFIIEYVGEIIDKKECDRRLQNDYKNNRNFYIMNIGKYYIDPTRKGNNARFINHSCDPNCIAKMIKVNNQDCVGIYSVKKIEKNEEITFNYNAYDKIRDNNFNPQQCFCGSVKCKKVIFRNNLKIANNNDDDVRIIGDNIEMIHKNKNNDDDCCIIGDNIEMIYKNNNSKKRKCYDNDEIKIIGYNPPKKRKTKKYNK